MFKACVSVKGALGKIRIVGDKKVYSKCTFWGRKTCKVQKHMETFMLPWINVKSSLPSSNTVIIKNGFYSFMMKLYNRILMRLYPYG